MTTQFTPIELAVHTIIEDEDIRIDELQEHGCVSDMVSSMTNYSDTLEFYSNHKTAINDLLKDVLDCCGFTSPDELFGNKWDKDDWLCIETNNQNLLAWFAFENVACRINDQ